MLGAAIGFRANRLWRKPANGVDPLNSSDAAENAVTLVHGDVEEEPGDCGGIGRVEFGRELANDPAAVIVLPGRAGEVLTDRTSLLIIKKRVRGFEHPAFRTADVDLDAAGARDQKKLGVRRCGDGARDGHDGILSHGEKPIRCGSADPGK